MARISSGMNEQVSRLAVSGRRRPVSVKGEIVAAIAGLLLGTVISFGIAPARSQPPSAAVIAP